MWTLEKQLIEVPPCFKKNVAISLLKRLNIFSHLPCPWAGKNFFRNLLDITSQVWIELEGIELYHNLALSFKEKGKRIIPIPS
jgi:hypothetical protein